MSAAVESPFIPYSHVEQLREARAILTQEAAALGEASRQLDASFCSAVELIAACGGSVIATGMGKAGLIARKIAATFSSTGTPAHFLHPGEAVHGDVGCLRPRDVLLALSNSGETSEVRHILPVVRRIGAPIVAITASDRSTLALQADVVVRIGRLREAGLHGLAPTSSTTAMLAVGDALALVVSRHKGFTPQQFAVFHPAGSLGERLQSVRQIMRQGAELRTAPESSTIRKVLVDLSKPGRRTGAVMLTDDDGRLSGLFTDSDLARLLEQRREVQLDRPIAEVMTPKPVTISPDALLAEAVEVLSMKKVSELPVIDEEGRPIGLIDITDVIGLMPQDSD